MLYNSADILEDVVIDEIVINPAYDNDLFQPQPQADGQTPRSKPARSAEYPRSEVREFFEAGLWGGPFEFNTSDVVAVHPVPGLDKVQTVYIGYVDYVQLVIEFENGTLVTDAPPHRSKMLLQWIAETMNKTVKHVVPSHYHRDHAGRIAKYVTAGAVVVVP